MLTRLDKKRKRHHQSQDFHSSEEGGVRGGSFPGAERGGCCRWLWWHGEPGRQGGDADSAVTAALPPSQVSDSLPQGLTLHIAAVSL